MNRSITSVILAACGVALASDIPPPREKVDVPALVRQLGSPNFAEREEATRRLATLDVDAPPQELLAALKSDNPEVRDRAGRALRAIRESIAQAPERAAVAKLPRGERFARRGQIDLYVASTAKPEWKVDDDRVWVPPFDLMNRALLKGGMTTEDRKPNDCRAWDDFKSFRSAYPKALRFIRTDGVYATPVGTRRRDAYLAIQSAGVIEPEWLSGFSVSRGPVRTTGAIYQALILATGDVTCRDVSNAVVICDGDVSVGEGAVTCLIIARGKITIGGLASTCRLIAGKTVTIAKPIDPERVAADKGSRVDIDENATKPLGYITFFELSVVGVEVVAAEKGVKITKLADGKPFAMAGVQVGDIITEVNGKKPDSAESLRRLLRDALAIVDATVTLKRGDKTETVKVSLPE